MSGVVQVGASLATLNRPSPNGMARGLDYTTSLNLNVKVLDFVKSGGPILTIDRTIFEVWLGAL